jgi:hypothetical protein
MLLAGIFPAKQTQQKVMECSKIKKKLRTHNICVPGIMGTHNVLKPFFYGKHHPSKQTQQKVMECSEILSPIIQTHKNPLQTHDFSPAGLHKSAKFYGDATFV